MKAVVLAAGEGSRLRPLTANRPKAMLPVANRPLLEHILVSLVNADIDEVIFVVGHRRERIQNHFKNGEAWGVDITYVEQETPRGTGDALLQAEHYVSDDFLVLNGDRIVEASLLEALVERRAETGDACMAITEVDNPAQYGVVEVEGDRITDIQEKPPQYAITSDLINAGVYVFGPSIFSAIRQTESQGELELTDTLQQHLDAHPIRTVRYDGIWLELSHPWDLLSVNDGMLSYTDSVIVDSATIADDATVSEPVAVGPNATIQPGARVLRSTSIGSNAQIGANTAITNSVIFPDATIEPGTVLTNCIVGENATVGPNVTTEDAETDVVINDTVYTDVKFGGLLGDSTDVHGAVTVEPGAILGNRSEVASGATLSGQYPDNSTILR